MSAFSCGVAELDDFFRHEVEECVNRHYLTAYCVVSDTNEILGAFTLMNDALMIKSESDKQDFIDDLQYETGADAVAFFSRRTSYPAINIGHLGVSVKCQGKKIGMAIITSVVKTYTNRLMAGCQFITVDALNNSRTLRFYATNRFLYQTDRDFYSSTRRMYRIL